MSEFRDVLFELGTEELPPKSLLTLSRSLCQLVEEGLAKAGIRLKDIHTKQSSLEEIFVNLVRQGQ